MNKKNIIPQQAQPVVRVSSGTQAHLLAELSEENLGTTGAGVAISGYDMPPMPPEGTLDYYPDPSLGACSYDGDDA